MDNFRSRIVSHADKIQKAEEMETALVAAFNREARVKRERFEAFVREVIKPAFDEFKVTLREIGRDAVIISNLTHDPAQSITLVLLDRYLSFGAGRTMKLVNPKEDVSKRPNTRFYEVCRSDDLIDIRQRTDPQGAPLSMQVTYGDITTTFLENELAAFFEQAYPTAI